MNENNAYLLSFENFINKDFEEKSDANESKKVIVEEIETISEGYWKCMGCGKHIPLDIDRCECGYKSNVFYKDLCILHYYDKMVYNKCFMVLRLGEIFMFKNSSNKIKDAAEIICFFGMLFSFFFGIAKIVNNEILFGISIIILGPLCFWLGTLILYGFGELVENSQALIGFLKQETKSKNTHNNIPMSEVSNHVQLTECNVNYDDNVKDEIIKKMIEGKINTLEKWRKEGIITDEEFNEKKKELLGL